MSGGAAEESDGPLATATMDEICAELKKRFECVIVCTYRSRDGGTYETMPWFCGAPPIGLGLCDITKRTIWEWRRGSRISPPSE